MVLIVYCCTWSDGLLVVGFVCLGCLGLWVCLGWCGIIVILLLLGCTGGLYVGICFYVYCGVVIWSSCVLCVGIWLLLMCLGVLFCCCSICCIWCGVLMLYRLHYMGICG